MHEISFTAFSDVMFLNHAQKFWVNKPKDGVKLFKSSRQLLSGVPRFFPRDFYNGDKFSERNTPRSEWTVDVNVQEKFQFELL